MEQKYVTDKQGNKVLPITHIDAVRDSAGNTLTSLMGTFEDEVRGLVDTPHQNYVTVAATSSTTAATDVLPASGQSADTIYRVSNWDGSANSGAGAFSAASYSEYAWDDVSDPNKYIFLCVKSQIGEVFDISVYNNNAKYADLASALGTNGVNVPESLRKGGMTVKFVQSSDNKYVQFRYMPDDATTVATFTNVANWQGVDSQLTYGSKNVIESGAVYNLQNEVNKKVGGIVRKTFSIADCLVSGKGIKYTDGTEVGSTVFKASDYVEVFSDVTLTNNVDPSILGLAFYNSNKQFITNSGVRYSRQNNVVIPLPANAKYIRFCADTSDDTFSIVFETQNDGVINERINEANIVENNEKTSFKIGTYSAANVFVKDAGRCYCEVVFRQGVKNTLVLSDTTNFEIIAIRVKNSLGNIVSNIDTIPQVIEFTGSNTNYSAIVVCRLTSSNYIPYYKADGLYITNTYDVNKQSAIDSLTEDIKVCHDSDGAIENKHDYDLAECRRALLEVSSRASEIDDSMVNLYRTKDSDADSSVVTLPHSNGGLFILNVHRRSNNGFDQLNNVYFPNAQKDFSDICVRVGDDVLPMRKLFSGNIDVLPHAGIGKQGLIFEDINSVFYSTRDSVPAYSNDYGMTWQYIQGLREIGGVVRLLDSNGNLFFFKTLDSQRGGKLYRSAPPYTSYTEVIDFAALTPGATGIQLPSGGMAENPVTHRLFCGGYQESPWKINILASDDYGVTWSSVYTATNYQHIHNIFVDTNQSPAAVYVGCDGGGGILKSINNGETWVDLRTNNPDIPITTDYGVIFSTNEYRVVGGETSIVGGFSLQKTINDTDFLPVLSNGKGVYYMKELNGKVFGGTISTHPFFGASIIMSEDNCETWQNVYTLAPFNDGSASDGFRFLSKVKYSENEYQIIAGCQGNSNRHSVHILVGGDNYYAQFIIKVPSGVSQLTVESGHIASKIRSITNDYPRYPTIYSQNLNTGTDVLNIDSELIKMPLTPVNGGRQLGDIYPPIRSVADKYASLIGPDVNFKPRDIDLSSGGFHIGFWYKVPEIRDDPKIFLIYSEGAAWEHSIQLNRQYLIIGSQLISTVITPWYWPNVWLRIDINVTNDGKILVYCNGSREGRNPVTMTNSPLQYFTANNYRVLFIPKIYAANVDYTPGSVIQHFEITQGNISDEDAWNNYCGGLFDVE